MHASHRMGMENQTFMKVAAICTWLGDFITAWMVTDMMLQVNTYIIFLFILLLGKFLQFDWLRAVLFQLNFEIPTCENYKPFAGSSINK